MNAIDDIARDIIDVARRTPENGGEKGSFVGVGWETLHEGIAEALRRLIDQRNEAMEDAAKWRDLERNAVNVVENYHAAKARGEVPARVTLDGATYQQMEQRLAAAEKVVEAARAHKEDAHDTEDPGFCRMCDAPWPCSVSIAVAAYDALTEATKDERGT